MESESTETSKGSLLFRRLVAYIIDSITVLASVILVGILTELAVTVSLDYHGLVGDDSLVAAIVVSVTCAAVALFYYAVEGGFLQGTPGKILMGLRVCQEDGYPVGVVKALARTTVKLLLTLFPLAFLSFLFDKERRLPQDFLGTQVLDRDDAGVISTFPVASLTKRVIAYLSDLIYTVVFILLTIFILCVVLSILKVKSATIALLCAMAVIFGYPAYNIIFEFSPMIGTPGKRMMGLTIKMAGHGGVATLVRRQLIRGAVHLFPPFLLIPLVHSHGFTFQDLSGAIVADEDTAEPPFLRKTVQILTWVTLIPVAFFSFLHWKYPPETLLERRIKNPAILKVKRKRSRHLFKSNRAELVKYESQGNKMSAWIVKPKSGPERKPAVLFAQGGPAVGPEDVALVEPFVKAGYIVMLPAFRGENGNPGYYEMCYGEVLDAAGALKYLRERPDVDKDNLFAAGDRVGATILLILVESEPDLTAAALCSPRISMEMPRVKKTRPIVEKDEDREHYIAVPTSRGGIRGAILGNIFLAIMEAGISKMEEDPELPTDFRIGPYPDNPCSTLDGMSHGGWYSYVDCPTLLIFGISPQDEIKMAHMARDYRNRNANYVSLIRVKAPQSQAMKAAIPEIVQYFNAARGTKRKKSRWHLW